jgi:hypothetical protein
MWTTIGAVAAVVAIPITVWSVLSVRMRAYALGHLDFELVSGTQLVVPVPSRFSQKLQVLVDGETIDDPHLLLFRVVNTSRVNIGPTEFGDQPYVIRLDREVRSADIVEYSNDQMQAEVQFDGDKVRLLPTLLREREWIAIAIVTVGRPCVLSVDLRTPEIAMPMEFRLVRPAYLRYYVAVPLALVGSMLVGILVAVRGKWPFSPGFAWSLTDVIMGIGVWLLFYWTLAGLHIWLHRKYERRYRDMRVL